MVAGAQVVHKHVVLTAIQADFPARQAMAKHLPAGAYLACMFCILNGQRVTLRPRVRADKDENHYIADL